MNALQRSRHRWFQFSLRALLALSIVGGAALGWIGWRFDWATRLAGRDSLPVSDSRVELVAFGSAEPPTDAEVLAVWRKTQAAPSAADDVVVVKETVSNRTEPARVYPLVGPAQLSRVKYKCTIYYKSQGQPQVAVVHVDSSNLQPIEK